MNLYNSDCGFPEARYSAVLKETPEKKAKIISRYTGKIRALDGIWLELKNSQSELTNREGNISCLPTTKDSSLIKGNGFRIDCTQLGPIHRKGHQKIISIKNLFSNAPKFQKHFTRGVFLSCLIYSEDKILVTLDDLLPTLQIDEDLNGSFQTDFYWLHKVSCIWNDAKFLKQEMEKCDSASTLHFRLKMLHAIVTMQEALDFRDLGKLFYRPITTENNNVTFICSVNHLRSPKLISATNVKWVPTEKFKNRKPISETYDTLSYSYHNLMLYHQMSNIPLGKGLYLGYFKLVTSVDHLRVVVSEKLPSIIPHVKVRNNPQVTKDEWELISSLNNNTSTNHLPEDTFFELTEAQALFRQQLDSSVKKLFSNMKINRNAALNHRFFSTDVIEISSSVSVIILLPASDKACVIEGDQKDAKWIEDNKLMTLPIQVFEMIHMLTYHNTLARRFMKLSATIEIQTTLAQHNRRKAFSSEEMAQCQHQLQILNDLQCKLESTWKECRWIFEVIKESRSKDKEQPTLREFLNRYNNLCSLEDSPEKPKSSSQKISSPEIEFIKKFQRATYVNRNCQPNLLGKTKIPGDILLPANPNFKYESCSSLPVVSKNTATYEKLRSSASLFDMKLSFGSNELNPSASSDTMVTSSCDSRPGMQELDSYMKHISSRSKLVSLSSMASKLSVGIGVTSTDECVPGAREPQGLKSISWTKQRCSLDRCFDISLQPSSTVEESRVKSVQDKSFGVVLADRTTCVREQTESLQRKVVEIFPAYECGLKPGTCVKLQITSETESYQIIQLLVHKLNEEATKKGNDPQLQQSNIMSFCLVGVIGARERVLRMDSKPVQLMSPWDRARLFVRHRNDVTAAVMLESIISSGETTPSNLI